MNINLLSEMRALSEKIDREHLQELDVGMYLFLISWGVQLLLQAEIERRTDEQHSTTN